MSIAELVTLVAGIYFAIGLIFAIVFIARGVAVVDANTSGTSIWFRLILLPGSMALWPILLKKWIQTSRRL